MPLPGAVGRHRFAILQDQKTGFLSETRFFEHGVSSEGKVVGGFYDLAERLLDRETEKVHEWRNESTDEESQRMGNE